MSCFSIKAIIQEPSTQSVSNLQKTVQILTPLLYNLEETKEKLSELKETKSTTEQEECLLGEDIKKTQQSMKASIVSPTLLQIELTKPQLQETLAKLETETSALEDTIDMLEKKISEETGGNSYFCKIKIDSILSLLTTENMFVLELEKLENIYLKTILFTEDNIQISLKILIACCYKLPDKKEYYLEKICNRLLTIAEEIKKDKDTYSSIGMFLPITIVKDLYLLDSQKLIECFEKHFQKLSLEDAFLLENMPTAIKSRISSEQSCIASLLSDKRKGPLSFVSDLEKQALTIQRSRRMSLRIRSEIKRLQVIYKDTIDAVLAKKIVLDQNILYGPKCNKALALKIKRAALKVTLFTEIRHLTATSSINSIFNDGLLANATLQTFRKSFRHACLACCDIKAGDGNAICFAPFDIDPKADREQTTELVFDLQTLQKANAHCMFFKQRDFGYSKNIMRQVNIPGTSITLYFLHTLDPRSFVYFPFNTEKFTFLVIRDRGIKRSAQDPSGLQDTFGMKCEKIIALPQYLFMSRNIKNIHAILILNFFRFIDALQPTNPSFPIKQTIYEALTKLDEEQMLTFLTDLGKNFADTAEFNFYGAHKINFDSLKKMTRNKNDRGSYELNMANFINTLNEQTTSIDDRLAVLQKTSTEFPEAFSSYCFIDYLITKTCSDLNIKRKLEELRRELDHTVPMFKRTLLTEFTTRSSITVSSALEDIHRLSKSAIPKVDPL